MKRRKEPLNMSTSGFLDEAHDYFDPDIMRRYREALAEFGLELPENRVLSLGLKAPESGVRTFESPKTYWMAIPLSEININYNLVQNPGY